MQVIPQAQAPDLSVDRVQRRGAPIAVSGLLRCNFLHPSPIRRGMPTTELLIEDEIRFGISKPGTQVPKHMTREEYYSRFNRLKTAKATLALVMGMHANVAARLRITPRALVESASIMLRKKCVDWLACQIEFDRQRESGEFVVPKNIATLAKKL